MRRPLRTCHGRCGRVPHCVPLFVLQCSTRGATNDAAGTASVVDGRGGAVPSAAVARRSSPAPWVESTLHYDSGKLKHLSDVFAGVALPTAEAARSASSTEQHLRLHPLPDKRATASKDAHGPQQRHQRRRRRRSSSSSSVGGVRAEEIHSTTSWMSALACTQLAPLVADLVRVHTSLAPSPPPPATSDPAATLDSLLASSRLAHSAASDGAVALDAAQPTPPSRVASAALPALCVLAAALEASLAVFRRVGAAVAQAAATPPPAPPPSAAGVSSGGLAEPAAAAATAAAAAEAAARVAAWRRERVCEYIGILERVVDGLLHALSDVTATPLSTSHSLPCRIDLIPLALLSVVVSADVCAFNMAKLPHADGSAHASSLARLGEQLPRLCLEVGRVFPQLASGGPLASTMSTWTPTARLLEHFYGTRFVSTLAAQTRALVRRPLRASDCLPALQTTLFICVMAIARRAVAGSTGSTTAAAAAAPSALAEPDPARVPQDAETSALLSAEELSQLAAHVEHMWRDVEPCLTIAPGELIQLQHRTTHTALNVSLATWWRAAAAAAVIAPKRKPAKAAASTLPLPVRGSRGADTDETSAGRRMAAYWRGHPEHVAALLCSYATLLFECRAAVVATGWVNVASTESYVSFYGRVVRVGLGLQLGGTCLAAVELGIEPRAPPTPSTPLARWGALRVQMRRRRQRSGDGVRAAGSGELDEAAVPHPLPAADAADAVLWARVHRLCGGVRVAATELLYSAVVELCQSRSDSAAVRDDAGQPSSPSPAMALVHSVSRTFFAIPRQQYLFGGHVDDEAGEEECRRVYAACLGVLVWMRELAPPFGVRDDVAPRASSGGSGAATWLVCGTSSDVALDASYFLSYYLHHWPSAASRCPPAARSALEKTLTADGVGGVVGPPSTCGSRVTSAVAEEYVKEALFQLQHDTARQLHHLRTAGRLHYFTGQLRDRAMLIDDAALRQRHVRSTLAVVQAHHVQPTLLWMPLSQAQELVFVLAQYPHLLRASADSRATGGADSLDNDRDDGGGDGVAAAAAAAASAGAGAVSYAPVLVGDITCTFARLHGFLVKRLHVLGGILREYRSLLLECATARDTDGATVAAAPSSFVAALQQNATHSPQLATHRQNNHVWAYAWATQLREEFPQLAAQMEGAPRWADGVLRVLDRLERTMSETHRHGLFINVVKAQQEYQQRRRGSGKAPLSLPSGGDVAQAETREGPGERVELTVRRDSARVPLGVALDGNARVLRVEAEVRLPANTPDVEGEMVDAPLAAALRQQEAVLGHIEGADGRGGGVVGWRVLRVDGEDVGTGRDVAAQVHGKETFTLLFERC
ncbi:hypothetical protein NESM_000026200 [Novymonas esmeraldas]|uniref:Uncharacterized protein n=1 Tax=Novymonas esmeraldas TaxID=1808958 RepID=A0AAW0F082_9TRYP